MNARKHLAVFSLILLLALTPIEPLSARSRISTDRAAPHGVSTMSADPNAAASPQFWAKTYGGSGDDVANAIVPTSDGGYVVAGYTTSFGFGGRDVWVLKLDGSGNVAWQKVYGGGNDDIANAIVSTSDGGYVVAGSTQSFGQGGIDAWVLRLDGSGNVIDTGHWQKTYGSGSAEYVNALAPTSDGGYVVAGITSSFGAGSGDFWVVKLDGTGLVKWQYTYGGSAFDTAYAVAPTSDGGYVVAGWTNSFGAGTGDAWVLKLGPSGNVLWQRTYGGAGDDVATAIAPTSDGGYVVAGKTFSFGAGMYDAWVLKLDGSGNIVWQKTYGGNGIDYANAVAPTSDGGYVVAAMYNDPISASFQAWILKLDGAGNVAWQKTYGGSGNDSARAIAATSDGGYVMAGQTSSFVPGTGDAWVLKLDADGMIGSSCSATRSAPPVSGVAFSGTISSTLIAGNGTTLLMGTTSAGITNTSATVATQCAFTPAVQFSSAAYTVNEPITTSTATITAILNGPHALTTTVDYSAAGGSAVAGVNYAATVGTLTFLPGQTSRTFEVPIFGDHVYKGDLTVNLALTNPANTTLGSPNQATLTIMETDAPASAVYLPLALRDWVAYFAGPCEVEPNDSYLQANGPLRSGVAYCGYANAGEPGGADKDFFSVYLLTPGTLAVDLSHYTANGQLQLFYQDPSHLLCYATGAPYHIVYQGSAGWYYINIATVSGFNSTPYSLTVTYPSGAAPACPIKP